jgi:alkyl sulfatase BDS1-like metallo-beta-lactamase superfamily hydrolase
MLAPGAILWGNSPGFPDVGCCALQRLYLPELADNCSRSRTQRGGAAVRVLAVVAVLLLVGGGWLLLNPEARESLQREAEIAAMEKVGEIAADRMGGPVEEGQNQGTAAEMINRPIEIHRVSDNVFYASGVGNTVIVTTEAGNVVFDTGLVLQSAKQLRMLKEQASDAPVPYVILSHSHADHVGGTRIWQEPGTEIIAHEEFLEEQRYLTELDPYFYQRNRTLFPWIPEKQASLELLDFRGIKPDIEVDNDVPYRFQLGSQAFEVIAAPGAEGADNLLLWLPDQRILLSGDFFGPQFPQFPNIFTMRGEKVRRPVEYVESLNRLLELQPAVIVPSHLSPVVGEERIRDGMTRMRDAVTYVHDRTVAGMNEGKTVYELMREIRLPPELELSQNHGKVSWAVKSIWEYYATWFHFDTTTELYAVPARDIYADLARLAGQQQLLGLARNYLDNGEPEKALHALEVALAADSAAISAQTLRVEVLETLLARARSNEKNDYEIYWLEARLSQAKLAITSAAEGAGIEPSQ